MFIDCLRNQFLKKWIMIIVRIFHSMTNCLADFATACNTDILNLYFNDKHSKKQTKSENSLHDGAGGGGISLAVHLDYVCGRKFRPLAHPVLQISASSRTAKDILYCLITTSITKTRMRKWILKHGISKIWNTRSGNF